MRILTKDFCNIFLILMLLTVFAVPSVQITRGADSRFILETGNYNGKPILKLNGAPWYAKGIMYSPWAPIWGSIKQDIQNFKRNGINFIYIEFDYTAQKSILDRFFAEAKKQTMPVIAQFNYWNFWRKLHEPEWSTARMQLWNGSYVNWYPNFLDSRVIQEMEREWEIMWSYISEYQNNPVIAVGIGVIDEFHIPDGEIHEIGAWNVWKLPHLPSEVESTQMPYNPDVLSDYRNWLEENKLQPEDLGMASWAELYLPFNSTHAQNVNHWLSWIQYRAEGYTYGYMKRCVDWLRSRTSLPITHITDTLTIHGLGLQYSWGIPVFKMVSLFDFLIVFHDHSVTLPELSILDAKIASSYFKDKPIIYKWPSYRDREGKYVYNAVISSAPYVSGHMLDYYYSDTIYDPYIKSVNEVEEKQEWLLRLPPADIAIFVSQMDAAFYNARPTAIWMIMDSFCRSYVSFAKYGVNVDIIFDDNNLSRYKAVLLPSCSQDLAYSSKFTSINATKWINYVQNGGVVVKFLGEAVPIPDQIVWFNAASNTSDPAGYAYTHGDGWSGSSVGGRLCSLTSDTIPTAFRFKVSPNFSYEVWIRYLDESNGSVEISLNNMVACAFFRRNTKEWRFHKFTVPASMISGSRECEVELKTKPSLIIADISIRPIIPIVPERGTQYYGSETGNLTQPLPTEAGGFTGLMTPNVVNPIFEYVQPCDGQIAEPTLHKPNATRVLETNTIVSIKQFGEGWGIRVGLPIDFASAYWQAPPTVTKPGILRLEPRAQMSLAGLLLLKAPIFTFVVQAKDSLGRNLSNVKVILTSEDRTQLQGTTDSDGVSTFKLICGKYQLQTFYRGTLVNQSSIDIRDENLLVSKIIICSVYDLTLQVLDHRGKPAKNVSVVLSGTVNERGKTNSNGFVTFSQLPQGNYTISAKDWFLEAEMSIELNSNLTIELILQYSNMLYVLIGASAILALCVIVILLKRKAKSFRKKKRHEKIYLAVNM